MSATEIWPRAGKAQGEYLPPATPARDLHRTRTITEALIAQAARRGSRAAFTVLDLQGHSRTLSYGELLERSLCVAATLKDRGLRQGDRVLVCLPTSPELLLTLYGTLLAGGVCVPLYPPNASRGIRRWKEQLAAVGRVAQPVGAVVAPESRLHAVSVLESLGGEIFALTPEGLEARDPVHPAHALPEEDLAFIQFTSGTTRLPRGVSVTHAALMANMRALLSVMPLSEEDVSVSWLPPYHDMGLVGHVFVPVLCSVHQYLMPPAVLLRKPAWWLQAIGRTRATQTTAPNFAYAMCARRISPAERSTIDLGSLRWALNGSEPVQADTLASFCETFGPRGFDSHAFRPVYGMAEATLAATFSPEGGIVVDRVDRSRLVEMGEARAVAPERAEAQTFVSVGCALPGHELQVVRRDGQPCAPREVGEIRFRGPSVTTGYFNNPQATAEVLREGWLWTGDLGYEDDRGLLYVTGRKKELIIKGGRNYLPQDIEAACLGDPAVRAGRAVAFGVTNRETGTEDLVLVAEVRDPARLRDPILLSRLARAVAHRTGLRPDRVELVQAGTLPRTTSGKLQRNTVRAAYESGRTLRAAPPPVVDTLVESARSVFDLAWVKVSRALGWE